MWIILTITSATLHSEVPSVLCDSLPVAHPCHLRNGAMTAANRASMPWSRSGLLHALPAITPGSWGSEHTLLPTP